MDQALDFSFHKGNSLVVSDDEPESPKPMPKSPEFCHPTAEIDVDLFPELNEPDSFSSVVAVEVIESLRISPARSSTKEEETVCPPSTSSATENLCSLPGVNSSNGSSTCVSRLSDHTQPSSPKPKAITKVPEERGFTQVDWLKLTRTQTDLAGLNGATNRRFITKAEVELHQSETDAWTILRGRVYNITHYLKFHPGGVEMLMQAGGQDCTSLFNQYHSWVNAEYILEKCLVGFLDLGN